MKKTGIAAGPSQVSLELVAASGGVGIQVIAEICWGVQHGFGMPVERALSIVVPIYKVKDDIRICICFRAVKLLEHGMKSVDRVLENRLHRIVTVDEMLFAFMHEIGTIDVVFILRWMQEEYHAKGKKMYKSFVYLVKAFDGMQRKELGWAMRKKGLPDVLVRSVMILCEGEMTRDRVDSEFLEKFEFKVGMHQGSVLSPFFALVVDVVTEFAKEGALSELLYVDHLVLMWETIRNSGISS